MTRFILKFYLRAKETERQIFPLLVHSPNATEPGLVQVEAKSL